jgi:hypothetical protein
MSRRLRLLGVAGAVAFAFGCTSGPHRAIECVRGVRPAIDFGERCIADLRPAI